MGKPLHVFGMVTAGVASFLLLAGCVSNKPGSSSIAYVNITSHAAAAIRAETVRVFADDNYGLIRESGGQLVFERKGTQRDQVMYGRYEEPLVMRVVVFIEPQRQGGCVLRADAYALNDRDETKVLRIARRPYQDLLNRVKTNLVKALGAEVTARGVE
jgi:hypothetical protein